MVICPVIITTTLFPHEDGCPEDVYFLSEEFNVHVTWPESEIYPKSKKFIDCPCGTLDATDFGHPNLTRVCGGSYTYGAVWENVINECDYSENAYKLCSVTQVRRDCEAEKNTLMCLRV